MICEGNVHWKNSLLVSCKPRSFCSLWSCVGIPWRCGQAESLSHEWFFSGFRLWKILARLGKIKSFGRHQINDSVCRKVSQTCSNWNEAVAPCLLQHGQSLPLLPVCGIVAWLGKQVWIKDATRVVKGGKPRSTRHFVGRKCAQKSLFLSICMQALTVPWQLPQFPLGTDLKFKVLRSGPMLCQIFFLRCQRCYKRDQQESQGPCLSMMLDERNEQEPSFESNWSLHCFCVRLVVGAEMDPSFFDAFADVELANISRQIFHVNICISKPLWLKGWLTSRCQAESTWNADGGAIHQDSLAWSDLDFSTSRFGRTFGHTWKVTVSNAASASQDVMPTVVPSQWFAETPSAGPKEAGLKGGIWRKDFNPNATGSLWIYA